MAARSGVRFRAEYMCDAPDITMQRSAAAGVPHYWMLDPLLPTLHAHRLGEHGHELVGVYGPGAIFRPELFPGLDISIDDLYS
jgi:Uma2 family endonuclease